MEVKVPFTSIFNTSLTVFPSSLMGTTNMLGFIFDFMHRRRILCTLHSCLLISNFSQFYNFIAEIMNGFTPGLRRCCSAEHLLHSTCLTGTIAVLIYLVLLDLFIEQIPKPLYLQKELQSHLSEHNTTFSVQLQLRLRGNHQQGHICII